MTKLALLIAPFRNRTKVDEASLRGIKLKLANEGWVPLFLPDTLCDVFDDEDPKDRALVLTLSRVFVSTLAQLAHCEAFVVEPLGGGLTQGMRQDVAAWTDAGRDYPRTL